jgi:hypothetical protein
MAGYRVSSVDLSPRCSKGKEHINRAYVVKTPEGGEEKTGSELEEMQRNGDAFVLIIGGRNELDWPSVTFDDCVCKKGIVMMLGKSAYQLANEARATSQ